MAAFAGRLLLGETLYLVSALNLPVLANLHIAGGFWQLAPDAAGYDLAARQVMGLADPAGLTPSEAEDPFVVSVAGLYTVFGTNPSPVLALNAALAAACVPLLFVAARDAGLAPRMALLTAAVAGLWPSSFAWSGQMLKDAMAWFGLCAAMAGTAALLRSQPLRDWRAAIAPGALVVVGEVALVLIRRYAAEILVCATLAGLVLTLIVHRKDLRARLLSSGVLVLALAAGSVPMRSTVVGVAQTMASDLAAQSPPALREAGTREQAASAVQPGAPSARVAAPSEGPPNPPGACRPASMLLNIRNGFDNTGGASLVDTSVRFRDCRDVLTYAPRALELSYLEPTPLQWLHPGRTTGPARHLAALDAFLLWLLLPGVLVAALHLVRRPNAFQLLILVYVVLVGFALGLSVTNFGTLFRLRLQGILAVTLLAAEGWMLIAGWLGVRLKSLPAPVTAAPGPLSPQTSAPQSSASYKRSWVSRPAARQPAPPSTRTSAKPAAANQRDTDCES
jgi:hypothetical protein